MPKSKQKLSVVIGRFQVPRLHEGHLHLLEMAARNGHALLVVLGSRRALPTQRNPLSFAMRKAMVLAEYPHATVLEHFDHPSDSVWSTALDALIQSAFPGHSPTLFGSRDSFIPHYRGAFKTKLVKEVPHKNGTALREHIAHTEQTSEDFRRGVIHTHTTRLPIPYPAIDVAVLAPVRRQILLGEKKADAGKRRFIGGFFDPSQDESMEHAAKRETREEAPSIEVCGFDYIGSRVIDDWRYRDASDKIVSSLFATTYVFGATNAGDDLDALHWVNYADLLDVLTPEHLPFGEMLAAKIR
ncbi:MAG: NUDIX domain-containing protein [Candidatus Pacebacteria bacterium]|nr:NUDIX domain-containing protein [Candidatus Paceibacterota bacterium]